MESLTIGISDCSKYPNYENWFLASAGVRVIKLSYLLNNAHEISNCDGLVLTGGQDVHPRFYGKPEFISYSKPQDIDEQRDEFEFKLLEYAHAHQMPILGICRGLQVVNVFLGGSLVPDIPSFKDVDHSKFGEGNDRYHSVTVEAGTKLFSIASTSPVEINSAHHQGADIIGRGLFPNAFSPDDGFVEGLENGHAEACYILLVQWHPERMKDQANPLAAGIRLAFLEAVKKQKGERKLQS
jgi:putative glutamine amidotransferase